MSIKPYFIVALQVMIGAALAGIGLFVGWVVVRQPAAIKDHPAFLNLYDYEWSALSAGGTILAAIVASFATWIAMKQPVWMLEKQRKQAARDAADAKKERLHEATGATFDAIDVYFEAYEAVRDHDKKALITLAATARGMAGVLKIISRNPLLSDGAIFACVNVQTAMEAIVTLSDRARNSEWAVCGFTMDRLRPVVDAANKRAIAVRHDAGIRDRTKGNHEAMPSPIRWLAD